jgi:hypothetical protein
MVHNGFGASRDDSKSRAGLLASLVWAMGGGAARGSVGGVLLLAVSVGRTLSPSASVVGLLKSDFLAYYC